LVLSVPSAILAAIAAGARRGILFRGGVAVEQLAEIELVAMDKTGTLTTGELKVETVESFPPGREKEVAELAYALERLSTHPLARAVTHYGKQNRLLQRELTAFVSVTGCGLQAETVGVPVRLGKRSWVLEVAGEGAAPGVAGAGAGGEEALFSEVWVASAGLLGRLRLRDEVRPESRAVVEALHVRGLRTVVLTGDRAEAAVFLQQTLELLAELDQHTARETHLQTALQDTQAQIVRLKHKLVDMASDSVDAEHEALAIAQARAHLATLLHDKLVQEFK
jgi:Cd2+/Zn2+-exporting ATPase